MDIESLKAKADKIKLLNSLSLLAMGEAQKEMERLLTYKVHLDQAQEYVQNQALIVQERVKYDIEKIVNMALGAVFGNRFQFAILFEIKRNKTEACLTLTEGGNVIDLLEGGSGGVNDVLSFALRIALLLISKNAKVLLVDEIMKGIDAEVRGNAYEILKTLGQELNVQCIMVSHDALLNDYADRVISF